MLSLVGRRKGIGNNPLASDGQGTSNSEYGLIWYHILINSSLVCHDHVISMSWTCH